METRHTEELPGAAFRSPLPASMSERRIAAAREEAATWRHKLAELDLALLLGHGADESLDDYLTAVRYRLLGALDQLRRAERGRRQQKPRVNR